MRSRREPKGSTHARWAAAPLALAGALVCLGACRSLPLPWGLDSAERAAERARQRRAAEEERAAAEREAAADELASGPLDPVPSADSLGLLELDHVLWIAGRAPLAGLSAGRMAEREAQSRHALDWIGRWLDGADDGGWRARLEGLLEGDGPDDELFGAAARVVGALGRYELAPHLIAVLERDRGRRRLAARAGLHAMFGEWFASADEVAPFLAAVEPGPGTRLLLARRAQTEALAREHLLAALRDRPAEALSHLEDLDPLVRAGVAEVLGEVLTGASPDPEAAAEPEGVGREAILAMLLGRLEVELEHRAFHALLGALVAPLADAADAPELERLRGILLGIGRAQVDGRAPSVAWAVARLRWPDEEGGRAGLLVAVEVVGDLLVELAVADLRRGIPDPDPMLLALQALQALCDRAQSAGLAEGLRHSRARQSVFALVQDVRRSDVVRATAGAALSAFALPENGPFLIAILNQGDAAPSVSHAILGALHSILLDFEADDPHGRAVMREVAELTRAADPDLRRRALSLLADPGLDPLVRTLDLHFLVERFADEEVPDLSRDLIGLLLRFGRPDMLDPIVSSARFAELAVTDPEVVAQLAEMVRVLSRGRAHESMRAAVRLADHPGEEMRLLRMRHALALMSALDDEAARELAPESHRTVCAWSWHLHVAGVDLREATPQGVPFVERLVRVHWPPSGVGYAAADPTDTFGEAARQHLLAVAFGILVTEEVPGFSAAEAEQAFARALKFAPTHPEAGLAAPVRRDRARFRAACGEGVKALADYRALVDQDALEIPDLRQAIALLESIAGGTSAGERAIAPETFDLLARIVGRRSWFVEPAAIRMQDLRDLADRAIRSGDAERMRRFVSALGDLPAEPPAQGATLASPPLWAGLAREPERLSDLQGLRSEVALALADPTASDSNG